MALLSESIGYLGRPAVLVGNGINLWSGAFPDWNGFLQSLGGGDLDVRGLTNTEIYDFIEMRSYEGRNLKKDIAASLDQLTPQASDLHCEFIRLAKKHDCPVLTTNFDRALDNASGGKYMRTQKRAFTRFYPWETYAGDRQLADPIEGFGIWHLHGMTEYPDSIRLGLTDYMGSVERARRMIHNGNARLFKGKDQEGWTGSMSWLHVWFNMPLVIVGFGLTADEVFIRWLLIERKRYFNQFPQRRKDTVYLHRRGDVAPSGFLNNLNIETRTTSTYPQLYR